MKLTLSILKSILEGEFEFIVFVILNLLSSSDRRALLAIYKPIYGFSVVLVNA